MRSFVKILAIIFLLTPILAACGSGNGDDNADKTGQISWVEGPPPGEEDGSVPTDSTAPEATVAVPTSTLPAAQPTETPALEPTEPATTGAVLTPDELAEYQPNELGTVPVLMYHNIVQEYEEGQEGDVLWRTEAELRADLQWLYDHDFYVIKFVDYVEDNIDVPAGKHPIVLTFDDSRPNQFYYIENADGSVTIDPHSAIAILEDFFASHPDFGHTALFAILPIWCFDFEAPDQTQYCEQKLQWLADNGYEIANHTWDHQDLSDVDNDTFESKIVDTSMFIEERVPTGNDASRVLVLPYGVFPSGANADQQWDWIRNGWDYNGEHFQLTSVVAAGANPAPSPSDLAFDIMSIARIGAKNQPLEGESNLFLDYWFSVFESDPGSLYTSDGNANTITIPEGYYDSLDVDKMAAEGKEVITY